MKKSKLKHLLTPLLLILGIGVIQVDYLMAQSLQAGAADEATGVTTTTDNTWENVTSTTLTLDGATAVMVVGNFEMVVTSGSQNVVGYYRLTDGSNTSAEISRYVEAKTYTDHGIGTVNHIFTYSGGGADGSKTFTLQHKRTVTGESKNITSKGNLIAIVVDDDGATLPNSIKATGDVTTTSTSYVQITGSNTSALNLSSTASIYLSATFSTFGSTSLTGNWILRKSTDGSTFTEISGASISRTNSTNPGAATITYLLTGQATGTYYFDVAHKTNTGTLTTRNLTLVALGLTGDDGNVYPSFSSIGGSGTTSSAISSAASTTSAITSENNTNSLFVHSSFNMTNNNVVNPIESPGFSLSASTGTHTPVTFNRYILPSGTGSGGLVGLVTGLSYNDAPTVSLNHYSDGTNSMTTQNINIVGFQLKSSPVAWDGSASNDWNNAENWSTGAIPTEHNNVKITTGSAVIADDETATCYDLIINGGTLIINAGSLSTGSLIVKGSASGNVNGQSYLAGNEWYVVSPIASGGTINSFITNSDNAIPTSGSNYGMMDYNESTNSWNSYFTSSTGGNLTAGKGYCLRRSSEGLVIYSGSLTSGEKTVSLTNGGEGWNCIGNPYTSAINMNNDANASYNFLNTNSTSLDASYACLYLWDHSSSSYKIVGNTDFGSRDLGQDVFQTGQGFFVKAKEAGSVITFNSNLQTHSNSIVLKSDAVSWPGFELVASSGQEKASTIIMFNEEMTPGLDVTYDAGLLRGSSGFEIYTRLIEDNGVDFAVQCLPETYTSLVIPVGLESNDSGDIIFSAETEKLDAACNVILEDKTAKIFTNLIDGATYKTTIPSGKTDIGRFYIHTSYSTTGAAPMADKELLKAYPAYGKIWITGKVGSSAKAQLFNLNGQIIGFYNMKEGTRNSISSEGLVSGVYLLRIIEGNNRFNFKVVIP